jgi:hypothetical protein
LCDLVYEITYVFFCLMLLVFSFIIRMFNSLCWQDTTVVITVHLISTCCLLRISCTYHHQTYRILYIHTIARVYTVNQSVRQISLEIFSDRQHHLIFLLLYRKRRKSGNHLRSGAYIFNECVGEQHVFELSESTTGDSYNVNMEK